MKGRADKDDDLDDLSRSGSFLLEIRDVSTTTFKLWNLNFSRLKNTARNVPFSE